MRAARMYGYHQALKLEDIPVPDIRPDEVLVKVGAAGMCRTDFQLIDGYFRSALPLEFPVTPGHEIAGWVDKIGRDVPRSAGFSDGQLVVVDGAWGDETCQQCLHGNQQICAHGRWAGFGLHGGYAEYLPVPYKHLLRVKSDTLTPAMLAPLTDAGLTPYRGVKKLRKAGVLGPGRNVAVMGAGGLGLYAVQYAKLLGGGARVIAFARTDAKLELAKRNGADFVINTRNKTIDQLRGELAELTGRGELDAVIDCVGAEDTLQLAFALLATEGAISSVGLVGNKVSIPLFPLVGREYSYFGSFWGNTDDLHEVISLAESGLIKHSVAKVKFEDVNDSIDKLAKGDFIGRAVIVYD